MMTLAPLAPESALRSRIHRNATRSYEQAGARGSRTHSQGSCRCVSKASSWTPQDETHLAVRLLDHGRHESCPDRKGSWHSRPPDAQTSRTHSEALALVAASREAGHPERFRPARVGRRGWTTTSDHDRRFGPRPSVWTTTASLDHDRRFGPRPPVWTTTVGLDHDRRFWTTTVGLDHDLRFWTTTLGFGPRP